MQPGHDETGVEGSTRAEFLGRVQRGGAALVVGGGLWRVAEAAAESTAAIGSIQYFRSRPGIRPPLVTVLHTSRGSADGHLFIAPSSGPGDRGPLILDGVGNVVWARPLKKPTTAMNFRAAVYKGKPVLTWWEGKSSLGLGIGEHVIVDDSYKEIARFPAGGGRQSDLHDFVLTPQGTALVTSYETRIMNTIPWGGESAGKVVGGIVQELDLPSGRVLFEWRSLDHVALSESHARVGDNFFDYFHINSIERQADGDLIVSARHTWAVYKISHRTGEVLWRLGGRRSDFTMGKGTVFAWQHDARIHEGGKVMSVFDNASDPPVGPQSRALLLRLDHEHRTATLMKKFTHRPGRLVSRFMGNAQLLPNGNMVVGWGGAPYVTEFAPNGSIVFDAKLPHGGQNYRAFRFPWVGKPTRPPQIAVRPRRLLYVSWNGATEIASWQLRSGRTAGAMTSRSTVPKVGFETRLTVPRGNRFATVVALDARGKPLGRTSTVRVHV